jgi:hypothetical protein
VEEGQQLLQDDMGFTEEEGKPPAILGTNIWRRVMLNLEMEGGTKKTVLRNKIPPLIATNLSKKTSKNT